jgi:hypothetical protein
VKSQAGKMAIAMTVSHHFRDPLSGEGSEKNIFNFAVRI